MTVRVIGLDPSLTAYGIAHADGHTSTEGGAATMRRRLPALRDAIEFVIRESTPTLAVIEDLPTHAKSAGLTGQVQGITRELLTRFERPYVTVPAATLKVWAADDGRAEKRDMAVAYLLAIGFDDLRPVDEAMRTPRSRVEIEGVGLNRDGGEVDAWWLRQLGLALEGEPGVPLTARRRQCLTKVRYFDADGREDKRS